MFSGNSVGDIVVVCSGKPHFFRERKAITYVNKAAGYLEVGGEAFDVSTGLAKVRFGAATHNLICRKVLRPEGEALESALLCEAMKFLTNLQLRNLKREDPETVLKVARLLGFL